jgi:hypothetical protein
MAFGKGKNAAVTEETAPGEATDPVAEEQGEQADFHHEQAHSHLRAAHSMMKDLKGKAHVNQAATHLNKLHAMAKGDEYGSHTPAAKGASEYGRG